METVSLKMPEEEKAALVQYAKDHCMTMSQVIRWAVKKLIQEEK